MKKYMIQCREIILYLVIDFDPNAGDEFVADAFDFTVIEKPFGSEAIFCLEDEYKSVWHAWDYTGGNTCLVARLKKPENAAHGYSEGSEIPNALVENPGPDKIRCDCELFVEKYFGLPADFPVDSLVPEAQYFQLVNLLSMFRDEQLAAANGRIKELEDFIADLYENVDPHEMQRKLHEFLTE